MRQPTTNTIEKNLEAHAILEKIGDEIEKIESIYENDGQKKNGRGSTTICKNIIKCSVALMYLKNSTMDNIKKLTPPGVTTYAMKRAQMKKKMSIELGLRNENDNIHSFGKVIMMLMESSSCYHQMVKSIVLSRPVIF